MSVIVVTNTKEIIAAALSNPNFFNPNLPPDQKIEQVCDLIKEVSKTMESK